MFINPLIAYKITPLICQDSDMWGDFIEIQQG